VSSCYCGKWIGHSSAEGFDWWMAYAADFSGRVVIGGRDFLIDFGFFPPLCLVGSKVKFFDWRVWMYVWRNPANLGDTTR